MKGEGAAARYGLVLAQRVQGHAERGHVESVSNEDGFVVKAKDCCTLA